MICSICKSTKFVSHCDRCRTLVCTSHAKDDRTLKYDSESWVCFTECRALALVKFDPRFHVFDWTTVADAAQQSLINELVNLRIVIQKTTEQLRALAA